MTTYRQKDEEEPAPPKRPKYLIRTTPDDFGNPQRCVRAEEDLMTAEHARLTPRVLRAAHDRAAEKEAMMGPTESLAAFFEEMDKLGSAGRIISRGKTVGFLGKASAGWVGRNR